MATKTRSTPKPRKLATPADGSSALCPKCRLPMGHIKGPTWRCLNPRCAQLDCDFADTVAPGEDDLNYGLRLVVASSTGQVVATIELDDYDLSKPLARASLVTELQGAVAMARRGEVA